MIVNLKQFCEQTGFPKKMIKTHARNGLLPYIPCGRRYLFDMEETLKRLELLKTVPVYTPPKARRERCCNVDPLPEHYNSGTEYLKARLKSKREAAAVEARNKTNG